MKKFLFAILLIPTLVFSQKTYLDSAVVTRATNATTYADGYVVRGATGSAFFPIRVAPGSGYQVWLDWADLCADTCNTVGATFDGIVYTDTTGIATGMPADGAAFQQYYAYGGKRPMGAITFSFSSYGTTAGGATGSSNNQSLIGSPFTFVSPANARIFVLLVARGAYKPKNGGKLRLIIKSTYY